MELILTEKEKKAKTWLELDDDVVGKVVKSLMFRIKEKSDEQSGLLFYSAALVLCATAANANADKLTETIEGLTVKGESMGDWMVTIKRVVR